MAGQYLTVELPKFKLAYEDSLGSLEIGSVEGCCVVSVKFYRKPTKLSEHKHLKKIQKYLEEELVKKRYPVVYAFITDLPTLRWAEFMGFTSHKIVVNGKYELMSKELKTNAS